VRDQISSPPKGELVSRVLRHLELGVPVTVVAACLVILSAGFFF